MSNTCALSLFARSPRPSFSNDDHFNTLSVSHVSGGMSRGAEESRRASCGGPHGSSETYPRGKRGLLPVQSTAAASAGGKLSLVVCVHGTAWCNGAL